MKNFAVIIGFLVGCSYINGQGDAPEAAREFAQRSFPGYVNDIQCQERDTDDNGYIGCTVVLYKEKTAEDGTKTSVYHDTVPIECGVNKVGSGCDNYGCKIQRGYR